MSNLVVDDVLFYHGGAADLGVNVEVTQNFGPKLGMAQQSKNDESSDCEFTQDAINTALKELAKQAQSAGANAVIALNISPTPILSNGGKLFCQVTVCGDAVTLTPKET
jgi:uncharacterized protein YbjQ (UPF0145 family)